MSENAKRQPAGEAQLRGEAAWKAHKEAVARRNAEACKLGGQRRRVREEQQAAERRTEERLEMAALARLRP